MGDKGIEFKEHLLRRRLKRVSKETLEKFWEHDIDFGQTPSLDKIVETIIVEYQIKKNNVQFINKFKDFLQESVLPAREVDYLISLSQPTTIVNWIHSWQNRHFLGQKHDFYLHTIVELNERYLFIENSTKISFPRIAIFVVAANKERKEELNGLELVYYHKTTEFEIIIRDNLDIVEIRGPYAVVKDFVATAILDDDNPLSAAKSYFVGDVEDTKKSLVKPIRQIVKIDDLKKLLDGSYKFLQSHFPGTKLSMIQAKLEDLTYLEEETNQMAQPVLEEMLKNPVKGTISFKYNQRKYSFSITKTGGLLFKEYMPEDVVTYIIHQINFSGEKDNGS